MASISDKFFASWKEALMMGAVVGVASYIGVGNILATTADSVGVSSFIKDPRLYGAVVIGGTAFVSNIVYDLAWR